MNIALFRQGGLLPSLPPSDLVAQNDLRMQLFFIAPGGVILSGKVQKKSSFPSFLPPASLNVEVISSFLLRRALEIPSSPPLRASRSASPFVHTQTTLRPFPRSEAFPPPLPCHCPNEKAFPFSTFFFLRERESDGQPHPSVKTRPPLFPFLLHQVIQTLLSERRGDSFFTLQVTLKPCCPEPTRRSFFFFNLHPPQSAFSLNNVGTSFPLSRGPRIPFSFS